MEINFYSRYPIDPEGYFEYRALVKENEIVKRYSKTSEKEIEVPVPYKKSFWDRFDIGIYAGPGYDVLGKKISLVNVGEGFTVDLF